MDSEQIIEEIDVALKRYYTVLNKADAYISEDGSGLFKFYCEDNGVDEIDEEFEQGAQDSLLTDFDEEFPFPPDQAPEEEEAQKEWIFNLLRQIRSDPTMSFGYLNQKFPTRMYYIFSF